MLHEALLDLWLEHEGLDLDPKSLTDEQWRAYCEMIITRSDARRRQHGF